MRSEVNGRTAAVLKGTAAAAACKYFSKQCTAYLCRSHATFSTVLPELWGMRSTPSLESLPAPLWPWVVTTYRVLSMGQIELNCNPGGTCPVSLGCRIHWLLLCRGIWSPSPLKDCLRYDTKHSDGEAPVLLELWGMRSTPSLESLPAPLWPWVVTPYRVLSMGQIELNCKILNRIVWNGTVFEIAPVYLY